MTNTAATESKGSPSTTYTKPVTTKQILEQYRASQAAAKNQSQNAGRAPAPAAPAPAPVASTNATTTATPPGVCLPPRRAYESLVRD